MNVLETSAPTGLEYELQSTNQGVLPVRVTASSGGGGGFTDSASVGVTTLDQGTPTILDLANAPPAFASFTVNGFIGLTFANNESSNLIMQGAVTVEVSTDSGVTYTSIGDPPGYGGYNPSTSTQQQGFVTIPFCFRGTGPATGNVLVRATFGDNVQGGTFSAGQITATADFFT